MRRQWCCAAIWRVIALFLCLAMALAAWFVPLAAQERQVDLAMRLVSGTYDLEATAGHDNVFYLELSNLGNRPITGLRLSADAPEGWTIIFAPETIAHLGAGSAQTVDVIVHPPERVVRREHQISIHAVANELRKVHRVWVTVRSLRWLGIAAAVVAVVIAAFVVVFVSQTRGDAGIDEDWEDKSP